MPSFSSSFTITSENSGSMLLITWGSFSTRVTATPRAARFSADSRPMKPPPMTAALRVPVSSFAAMLSASGTVNT